MTKWLIDTQALECDVLVIGGGFAALHAALAAAENKANVLIASKGRIGLSGASAVSMSVHRFGHGPAEVLEKYLSHMLSAGHYLGQPELIKAFIDDAPQIPSYLAKFIPELEIKTIEAAGRLYPNFVASPLKRGLALGRFIRQAVLAEPNIDVLEDWAAADLKPLGLDWLAWLEKGGRLKPVTAKAVVLATGGALGLYAYNSGTPDLLGEGLALAFNLGLGLRDMEFVQFYPYRIFSPKICDIFPDVFNHGARFLNSFNQRFMDRHPKKELENRDVLAREIYRQKEVRLDLTKADQSFLKKETARLHRLFKAFPDRPLLVRPVAHFTMGGLCVAPDCRTALPGLMAAGEIVGGLHGANRLAGHALSETVVFGRRAGSTAAQWASGQRASAQRASGRSLEKEKLDSFQPELPVPGGDDSESLLTELKTTMWNKVGLVRSEKGLKESLDEVESLNQRLIDQRPKSLRSWLTVSHALTAARLVIRAALLRKESRGAHFREDFPQTNDEFQGNYIQRKNNIDFIPAKVL